MQEIYRVLARLTRTDLTVMITGESGTGKELVARVLHDFSRRRNGPFVAINMAAIPRELIESELFGHEKGAFTGAQARTEGRFQQAEGGTLFLDEIGDMPMEAQTRLLRCCRRANTPPSAGRTPIKTDVRIIAATHRELKTQIQQGLLPRGPVLPPERCAAAPAAAARAPGGHRRPRAPLPAPGAKAGLGHKAIETAAIERLKRYHWPGNVRELENMVRRPRRAASGRHADRRDRRGGARRDGAAPSMETGKTPKELSEMVERYLAGHFAGYGASCPPPGSTTASCSTWSARC
jgi:two-component system nitrogen regulation response regulator GlnG